MVQSRSIDPNADAHCGSEHQPPNTEVTGRAGLSGTHLPYSHPNPSFRKSSGSGASSSNRRAEQGFTTAKTPAPPRTARPRARRSRSCRSGGAEEAEKADSARREARGDQAAAAASPSSGDGKLRLELWPEHCARRGPALSAKPTTPAQPAGPGPAPAQGQGLRKRAPGSYGTAGR